MTAWEYLFLNVEGHNGDLLTAKNMLVTTSNGRWQGVRMPTNVIDVVNQLGAGGGEMVNSAGPTGSGYAVVTPSWKFDAVFKRPTP